MTYKIYKYRNIIDLAQRIPFKEVTRALKYHYPYPRINKWALEQYERIIKEMSKYKEDPEKDKEWSILISLSRPYKFYLKDKKEWVTMDEPGEEYYRTHGLKKGEKNMTYAIEFTRWQETANWKIAPSVLKAYKPAEILAHFLWEMTYCGFKQAPIQKKIKDVNKIVDDIKSGKAKTTPYNSEDFKVTKKSKRN
jgi:hypothetical protein